MCGMVEMCRCAFSTFCEMHCPNQLGMFKLLGKHYNIVLFCVCNETTSCQPSHSVEFALIRLFKDVMEKKPETKAGC